MLPRYEYLWEDGTKFRRPTKLPAPEYVDALMNWAQNILDDEAIFPNKIGSWTKSQVAIVIQMYIIGVPFPKNFRDTVRTIFRRLFRVYGHIYSSHFDQVCALGIEGLILLSFLLTVLLETRFDHTAHLNTSYRHFFLFVHEVRHTFQHLPIALTSEPSLTLSIRRNSPL